MKILVLKGGLLCVYDEEDAHLVEGRKWLPHKSRRGRRWYAIDAKGQLMHRVILGLPKGDKRQGDHIRTEHTLDNRRCNLRIATQGQNQANRAKNSNNKSGFKGVSFNAQRRKYNVSIGVEGKNIWLGWVDDPKEGHRMYCEAAKKYHGVFARTA